MFILVAVLLLVLIGGAVAAYAYDSSRENVIAEGVTVAGVDVGGMDVDQARAVVERRLREPLSSRSPWCAASAASTCRPTTPACRPTFRHGRRRSADRRSGSIITA